MNLDAVKKCRKCLVEKDISDFSTKNLWCKACMCDYAKVHYKNNLDKRRNQIKSWSQSDLGKKSAIVRAERHFNKFPEKRKARQDLRNAVAAGKIKKPLYCSSCLNEGRIEAHHHDYTLPFNVVWLCIYCHKTLHGRVLI